MSAPRSRKTNIEIAIPIPIVIGRGTEVLPICGRTEGLPFPRRVGMDGGMDWVVMRTAIHRRGARASRSFVVMANNTNINVFLSMTTWQP